MSIMAAWSKVAAPVPPRGRHLRVLDPELTHACVVCAGEDNEDTDTFDMHYCDVMWGWVHRDCHALEGTCRAPECDPIHI